MGSLSLKANANNISASRVYSDPSLVSGLHKHLEWGKMFTLNQQHQMIIYFISRSYCLEIVHTQDTSEHHLLSLVILWSYPPSASLTLLTAILHPCPATETTAPARRLSSYPSVLSLVESERLGPVIHYLFVWHCDLPFWKISERFIPLPLTLLVFPNHKCHIYERDGLWW